MSTSRDPTTGRFSGEWGDVLPKISRIRWLSILQKLQLDWFSKISCEPAELKHRRQICRWIMKEGNRYFPSGIVFHAWPSGRDPTIIVVVRTR